MTVALEFSAALYFLNESTVFSSIRCLPLHNHTRDSGVAFLGPRIDANMPALPTCSWDDTCTCFCVLYCDIDNLRPVLEEAWIGRLGVDSTIKYRVQEVSSQDLGRQGYYIWLCNT